MRNANDISCTIMVSLRLCRPMGRKITVTSTKPKEMRRGPAEKNGTHLSKVSGVMGPSVLHASSDHLRVPDIESEGGRHPGIVEHT